MEMSGQEAGIDYKTPRPGPITHVPCQGFAIFPNSSMIWRPSFETESLWGHFLFRRQQIHRLAPNLIWAQAEKEEGTV